MAAARSRSGGSEFMLCRDWFTATSTWLRCSSAGRKVTSLPAGAHRVPAKALASSRGYFAPMLADDRSRFLTDLSERIGDVAVDGESLLGERALNITVEPVTAGVEPCRGTGNQHHGDNVASIARSAAGEQAGYLSQ